eukprot:4254365-Prymnesium_polylepis.2
MRLKALGAAAGCLVARSGFLRRSGRWTSLWIPSFASSCAAGGAAVDVFAQSEREHFRVGARAPHTVWFSSIERARFASYALSCVGVPRCMSRGERRQGAAGGWLPLTSSEIILAPDGAKAACRRAIDILRAWTPVGFMADGRCCRQR